MTVGASASDEPIDLPGVPASEYGDGELQATVRNLGAWWALLVDGLDAAPVQSLVVDQVRVLADALGRDVDAARVGPDDALEAIGALGSMAAKALRAGDLSRTEADSLLDASLALVRRGGRALAAAGALAGGDGTVTGLFRSDGGVPKLAVDAVDVTWRGLDGDRQDDRRNHGRPWQALCLWSGEVIDRLVAEGHPLVPGGAGENISIRELDWPAVRTGTRLAIGDEVLIEVTLPAAPCFKNAQWFVDGDYDRMGHEREPGISRMYASVLTPGRVATGDPVRLEPPARVVAT